MSRESRASQYSIALALGIARSLAAACGESETTVPEPAEPAPASEAPAPDATRPDTTRAPDRPAPPADGPAASTPVADDPATDPPPSSTPPPNPLPAVYPLPELTAGHDTALAAARTLRAAGQRHEAIQTLRDAEKARGADAQLRLEAAWCFQELAEAAFNSGGDKFYVKGNIADAKLRVDQAEKMHAGLPGSVALLARIMRWSEDPDGARELLTTHFEEHPDDLLARLEMAAMAENAREWETADTHLTKAVEIAPLRGDLVLRSTIAKQWAKYPIARLRTGYLRAAKLLPDEQRPVNLLVKMYADLPRQLDALDAVVAENPKARWARIYKAYLLTQSEAHGVGPALEVLDAGLALHPGDFGLLFQRAQTLQAAGDRDAEAAETLVTALENGPVGDAYGASVTLDKWLFTTVPGGVFSPELRERAYTALTEKNPGEGSFGNNAGFWYRDRGKDYEKSLKWYQASVAASPDDQDYLNDCALIWLFHLRDQKEKSLPMFNHVLALVEVDGQAPKRGYWDALENLCKYHFEIGEYEKVVGYAKKRANPEANVNGRLYPSMRAAQFAMSAQAELDKAKD